MAPVVSTDSPAAFDRMFDSLPVAACVIDATGRIVRPNALARSRWNAVTIGEPLHDAMQHLSNNELPCADARCALRRPPVSSELRREREAFRRADGSTVVFDWLSAPWPNTERTAIVLLRDVTERHRHEQDGLRQQRGGGGALQIDRERLRQIFDQAPASIAVLRAPDHVIEAANARAGALGEPDYTALENVSRTGQPHVVREVSVSAGADEHFFNVVYQPIASPQGSIDSILIFGTDITEQVRTTRDLLAATHARDEALVVLAAERRRLETINRELDQFAYAASHDLKAPLRGIANLAQWIEEDLQSQLTDDTRELLALMRSRMHRMEALIEGLLQFSRAGRVHERPEPVDTAALVADVLELLAPPDDTWVLVAPDMPTMTAERLPLQQVFGNLIGNAIKYAGHADARIFVDAIDRGDTYEFAVTDNGPGIAAEFHERVWGIFQSLQPHDKVEGTGIGLALVKKVVEARGGHVGLHSREGEGARFTFTWPKHVAYGDA